jgi:hypothetical protein
MKKPKTGVAEHYCEHATDAGNSVVGWDGLLLDGCEEMGVVLPFMADRTD